MRAELSVFNQSKTAFQFRAVYLQSDKRQSNSMCLISVTARIRFTFTVVRLQLL